MDKYYCYVMNSFVIHAPNKVQGRGWGWGGRVLGGVGGCWVGVEGE